jgi:hypothetical protein
MCIQVRIETKRVVITVSGTDCGETVVVIIPKLG